MGVWATVEILDGNRAIALVFPGGDRRCFHAIWLRDNAWDETTRAPGNGQKLTTLADLPEDVRVAAARVEGGTLRLTFALERRTIAYDLGWLAEHAYDRPLPAAPGWLGPEVETWDAALGAAARGRLRRGRRGPIGAARLAARRAPVRRRAAPGRTGRERRHRSRFRGGNQSTRHDPPTLRAN